MSLFSDARNIVSLTTRHSDLALVGLLVAVIALMIMPLPTALVDTLIGANLALSFAIMMMTMYVRTPLEFSSFPTMLLFTTLFRVGLNITTTRLILLNADAVGGASFAGMAFPLLAGFSYACYFVFSKPLAQNAAPGSVMMVLCLLSGLCMLPVFWIYPAAWLATPVGALVALHLGVVTTAIAFSLTLAGLKVTPAATASTLSLAEPLSAACLGIFFLHEPLSLSAAVGIALIFGSVLILVACPSGQPPRESAARLRPQGR